MGRTTLDRRFTAIRSQLATTALALVGAAGCLDPDLGTGSGGQHGSTTVAPVDASAVEDGGFDPASAALVFEFDGPTLFDPELYTSFSTMVRWQFSDSGQASGSSIQHDVAASGPQQAAVFLDGEAATATMLLAINDSITAFPRGLLAQVELRFLELNWNAISGTIPVALGTLGNLEHLELSGNQLSGAIPAELGNLVHLRWLALGGNQLTGPIPAALGNLASLQTLALGGNQLSGAIPPELGNVLGVEYVYLGGNQLTGTIPAELGNLVSLQNLNLERNQLTGAIPASLGRLTNLAYLSAVDNQLTGTIPAELASLQNLQQLNLNRNQLTRVAPGAVAGWTAIRYLGLDSNQLSQEAVGALLAEIWSARASYTCRDEVIMLDIGGSNASPSGRATDPLVTPGSGNSNADWAWDPTRGCHVPRTGQTMAYDLENDICGEGFNRWVVTYAY